MKTSSLVLGCLLAVVLVLVIAGYVWAAQHFNINIGPANTNGATRWNQYVTIYGASITFALFATFLVIGVEDWMAGNNISRLYPAQLAMRTALAGLFIMLGVTSLDFLLHGLTLHWRWMLDPDVRLLISAFYLVLVAAAAAEAFIIIKARGVGWMVLTVMIGVTLTATTVVIIVAERG